MSFHFRFDTLEEMLAVIAENVRAPERLSVSQAAEKYRYLREATHVGYWDNDIAPYLVEIMDSMESLEYKGVCFVGPARCGKSDIFFNWLTYSVKCDPGDMMVVHMTQSTSRDWSQGDLRKALRHSTALGEKVLPGKQNLNTHDVRFVSMRLLIKWPTITEVSGKTLRRGWIMDADRMPLDIDGEGYIYDLTAKRTQTYGRHGMTVIESSPGFEVTNHRHIPKTAHEAPPTEGILSVYNRGDRRRWYWQCASPECREWFEPDFKLLNYPDLPNKAEVGAMATLDCPHCGYSHTHDPGPGQPGKVGLNKGGKWLRDGQKIDADGVITGEAVQSDIAAFWLKGVAAAFVTWKELVVKFLNAMEDYQRTGDTGSLKATVNTDQGLPFTPPSLMGDRLPEDLKARAKHWERGFVPWGTRYLTATIDVQKNRFVVQIHGHGALGETYVVDRFDIRKSVRTDEDGEHYWLSPHSHVEDWHILVPEVIERTYALPDDSGRRMRIKAIGCDSGGREGVTVNAYAFWRWLRDEHPAEHHRRFQLVKGGSNKNAQRATLSYPDSDRKDRRAASRGEVPVILLNTDTIKDQVDGLLNRVDDAGERIIFADFLPDSFYSELTVEVRSPLKGWENPKKLRNEAWDLLVYDYGLGLLPRHIGAESLDWDNPPDWAEEWDLNTMVFDAEATLPFVPEKKTDKFDISKLAESLA
jgi:phage terminase large subunit GpA-like protein